MNEPDGPVLLYDGLCPFCNWAVRLVLRADRRRLFRFAPLDGAFAADVIRRHPGLQGVDSLVLVESGAEVLTRSDAVLRSFRLMGGPWSPLLVFAAVPRLFRDWAYDAFARWRYRLFGRYESCPVPPPDVRNRFLS